jgi:GNAT superfamily N-acetyltransferase
MGDIATPRNGKPAHMRTMEEFVGKDPAVDRNLGYWDEEAFLLHRAPYLDEYKIKRRNFFCDEPRKYGTSEPGVIRVLYHCYHLAVLKDDPAYALLLSDTMEVGTGHIVMRDGIVGEFYQEGFGYNILGIMEAYRGRGVGAHFVATAIEETGIVDPTGAYSPAGLATRKKAHRILVENAIKRGDAVPMEVLQEYEKPK